MKCHNSRTDPFTILHDLYWDDRAEDLGFSLLGNQLLKGINAARLALTGRAIGQGASLGVDLVRGGSFTGPGLSKSTSFVTAGIGGDIGGPLAGRGISQALNTVAKDAARRLTTNGVRDQMQDTINQLTGDVNKQFQNLTDEFDNYRLCGCK